MEPGIRTTKLYHQVFRLYSEPDRRRVTVREIVKAAGVPSNSIYYWYGDIDTLYRMAVSDRISALAGQLKWSPAPGDGPRAAVFEFARICASLFASEDYRRLLYLVVRDGALYPWLTKRHQSEILDAMQSALGKAVPKAGLATGARLEIRASACRAFVKRLQGELALPMLVPGQKDRTQQEVRQLIEAVAAETLAAVYSAGAVVHALEGLPVRAPAGAERPALRPAAAGAGPAHAGGGPGFGDMRAAAGG